MLNVYLKRDKMCLQVYLVIAAICILSVYPQNTVIISPITDPVQYRCEESLVLRCKSNDSQCCSTIGKARYWKRNGIDIMIHGTEQVTTGKYTETIDDTEDSYELTIHNLQGADFGKSYSCKYGSSSEPVEKVELEIQLLLCAPCWDCGGRCFAWGLFGMSIVIVIAFFCLLYKKIDKKKVTKALVISSVILLVLDLIVAFVSGVLLCICYDFSNPIYDSGDYIDPVFIALGITVLIYLIIAVIYWTKVKTINVTEDKTVELKCPFIDGFGRSITWHKHDKEQTEKMLISQNGIINEKLEGGLKSRLSVSKRNHLSISDVKNADEGVYKCSHNGYSLLPVGVCRMQLHVLCKEKKPTPG